MYVPLVSKICGEGNQEFVRPDTAEASYATIEQAAQHLLDNYGQIRRHGAVGIVTNIHGELVAHV